MNKVKVKICCISSIEEANMAIEAGASAIGLVGPMPSGPGIIDNNLIREIAKMMPDEIASFLLTSEIEDDKIIAHHKMVNTKTIQLVDYVNFKDLEKVRLALPNTKLVQVIHVIDEKSIEEAELVSSFVDAILLDSGNPNLAIKELGGTGRTHNWAISKEIVDRVKVPCYLAGGISKGNALEAIEHVKPYGVDLCSSVRTNDKLDKHKLEEFFSVLQI